jgi:cytochrome b561
MSEIAYQRQRRILHWTVAAFVLAAAPMGLIFTDFDNRAWTEARFGAGAFDWLYNLHKSLGLTVLALMLVRVWAKRRWPDPPRAQPLPAWQERLAHAAHVSLYVLLIVVPLLGWLGTSAFPAPVPVYGLFEIPLPVAPDRALSRRVLDLHGALAMLSSLIILAHVAAALHHRYNLRDGVFSRMWPDRR